MGSWHAQFSEEASRNFSHLDSSVRLQVTNRITWLIENFDQIQKTHLHNDLKSLFKLRAGDWRVTYKFEPDAKIIRIAAIDHRSKIYKRTR